VVGVSQTSHHCSDDTWRTIKLIIGDGEAEVIQVRAYLVPAPGGRVTLHQAAREKGGEYY
jgi:hypothetical protein